MHIRWTGAAAGIALACALGFTQFAQAATLTGYYSFGTTGPGVRELQSILDAKGYHIPQTGYFGPITESAVKNFQATHHLATDGIVGPLTEAAFSGPTTTSSASPRFEVAPPTRSYRVAPGDTLGLIASRFHTTWQHLAALNHLTNPNNIAVGQILIVVGTASPVTAAAEKPAAVSASNGRYTVHVGDTLGSIAARFHTSWQTLAQLNHLANPNVLAVGEVLILPGSSSATTTSGSGGTGSSSASLPVQSAPQAMGQAIVATARKYLGVPYVWGGESLAGFDCSGLVQYVLAQNGISIGRTTWDQWNQVTHIPKSALQPGDLVFFTTYAVGASHVGIYIGSGQFIDAPAPGQAVMVQSMSDPYMVAHYYGAGAVNP